MSAIGRVIGWKLNRDQRRDLLEQFPPRYPDTIADHVTLKTNSEREELPGPAEAAIVGSADDGDSLECLVVTINGTTDRPDGSTFHITWSLDKSKGREARESNDVLQEKGWEPLGTTIPIEVEPKRWP
ncbi:hypothetical protein LZ496_04775 [Sphingomonas sp. NSE70-1]|uniref:Uncharacterized protein n=1 Tax=Sphingomonas caseinilyticus TaxID=2908205 RepID=A0ABT0RT63_9SPHN|nr:hypothetical protein [Sphingomonas caseinilyticus]MCL6698099.1 hypothetical protein [Sphingomonas caseinilyticus]